MQNNKGIFDVKEQIWLTNVQYLRLSAWHFMRISNMFIYICVQFQKILTNQEYLRIIDMKEQI